MRGGQWQALRLIEGLAAGGRGIDAAGARRGRRSFEAAAQGGMARASRWAWFARAGLARARHDLVHAHDARSHTLAALAAERRWWSRGGWRFRCRPVAMEIRARGALSSPCRSS